MVEELLASKLVVKQLLYSNDEFSDISDSAVKISTKAMEQCSAMKTTPGILAVAQMPDSQPLDLRSVNLILDDIKNDNQYQNRSDGKCDGHNYPSSILKT